MTNFKLEVNSKEEFAEVINLLTPLGYIVEDVNFEDKFLFATDTGLISCQYRSVYDQSHYLEETVSGIREWSQGRDLSVVGSDVPQGVKVAKKCNTKRLKDMTEDELVEAYEDVQERLITFSDLPDTLRSDFSEEIFKSIAFANRAKKEMRKKGIPIGESLSFLKGENAKLLKQVKHYEEQLDIMRKARDKNKLSLSGLRDVVLHEEFKKVVRDEVGHDNFLFFLGKANDLTDKSFQESVKFGGES